MKLTVRRFDPEGSEPARYETYDVPDIERMTVLDALNWVREHIDPSLAVRFSCRVANACKECPALANGKATYVCTYPATGDVLVEPLPHKTLIRDLVVDID